MARSYKDKTRTGSSESARIACPLCGWWRTLNYGVSKQTGEIREVRFDKVDPATATLYRVEKLSGAGRASPDATIETIETRQITEIPEEYRDQIRDQCYRILAALEGQAP